MEEKINKTPLLGDDFPHLEVQTSHGKMNIPDDFHGQWFVLFSHPADFTPVCTTEFVAFQKRYDDFRKLNCTLIGLSVDQVFSHIKWIEWIKDNLNVEIKFPIIAANDEIANQLGMLHPQKGSNTVRAVFIVDPQGKLRLIMYYPQEVGRNMDEILRAVQALQISDQQGAMPANWPQNELIGDHIIVPPANSEDLAQERLKDKNLKCFDWWFCHQEYKK